MRLILSLTIAVCLFCAATAQAQANKPVMWNIQVLDDNWGGAPTQNIQAVCESAARELLPYFPERKQEVLIIGNNHGEFPITYFQRASQGEIQIKITTRGLFWSQFAYQFSHELCHVLCNFRRADFTQNWFEETLCETASLFVIRRLADTWKTNPPYPNWNTYASSLDNYADEFLSSTLKIEEPTIAEWYRKNRVALEQNAANRPLNQVVAVKVLLPLLQNNPAHWEAVSYLNQWEPNKKLTFAEYLKDWHQRVPEKHKGFVQEIAKRFEIEL